jgi:hypothetical protein
MLIESSSSVTLEARSYWSLKITDTVTEEAFGNLERALDLRWLSFDTWHALRFSWPGLRFSWPGLRGNFFLKICVPFTHLMCVLLIKRGSSCH